MIIGDKVLIKPGMISSLLVIAPINSTVSLQLNGNTRYPDYIDNTKYYFYGIPEDTYTIYRTLASGKQLNEPFTVSGIKLSIYDFMHIIPIAYQQVEYFQGSSAGPRIDTGVLATDKIKVRTKYMYQRINGGTFIGITTGSEASNWRFFTAGSTSYATYLDYGSGSGYNRISATYVTSTGAIYETEFGNRYIKDIPSGVIKCSGSAVSFAAKAENIGLLSSGDYGRIYYCKIYDSDVLVRDFYPCYEKSTNKIGAYDILNNKFYTSINSATFAKGDNIEKEL